MNTEKARTRDVPEPNARLTACISDAELQGRWALARELMAEHHVDCLLVRGDGEFLGGYVRWFAEQDTAVEQVARILKPGMRDFEVMAEVQ